MVRTRIAPSPTGYPHIGTIYQALFDYAFARKNAGSFIVRIEDTDRERFIEDAEEKIFASFDWFNLFEDESPRKNGTVGPYRQSERLDIYKKYALALIDKNNAYYCFCTKDRLDEMRKKLQEEKKQLMYDKTCQKLTKEEVEEKLNKHTSYVIRLKIPENKKIIITDEIRGEIEFDSSTIDDQVLLKADGFPTYHLAVVVDDHLMEITHIVRGEEWITSTPKHVLLYEYFGWDMPLFFHTPLLRNPDKSKLSKRHGHTNVVWYQEEGFLPEAILNFLGLLGWSHPEGKEVFSLEEFISLFELKDLKAVAPVFDLEKLKWMNGEYLRKSQISNLKSQILKREIKLKEINEEKLEKLIALAQERIKTLNEFYPLVKWIVEEVPVSLTDHEKEIGKNLKEKLETSSTWSEEQLLIVLKQIMGEYNLKMSVLYKIITGSERGLPLPATLAILGKEQTLKKLQF